MTQFFADREIESQPEIWGQVAKFGPSVYSLLPKIGEKVAVVGCGSSWFMAMSYASLRENLGHGLTDVFVASEFNFNRNYDRVLAITRSGTTTEILDVLEKVEVPSVVVTAIHDSPASKLSSESIVMDFADEKSVLQTRWATSVLALLRSHFGLNIQSIIKDAEVALKQDISQLVASEQITFLGRSWTIGLAHEAALKTRESAQFWAEAYPALDYRHGPLSISQQGRTVWVFGEIPSDLINDIRETEALLEISTLDPLAHLIVAQRVALEIARKRGLNADNPRGLSRSIILNK